MKSHVTEVELKLRDQNLISLDSAKQEILASSSGFYWIYTKLNINDFLLSPKPKNPVHVDFSNISSVHQDLKHIIHKGEDEYWCVYNGKGKQLKNRVVAEFSNTGGKTGTLALSRCFKEDDFKLKYIICNAPESPKGISIAYESLQRDLERAWRLNNGWPLLSRA